MTSTRRARLAIGGACLALLAACGSDTKPVPESSGAGTTNDAMAVVTIDRGAFHPRELTIAAGTTVTFVNDDIGAHTTTAAVDEPFRYDSGTLASGDSYTQTYDEPGTYDYVCTLHPTMHGTITVEDT